MSRKSAESSTATGSMLTVQTPGIGADLLAAA
jgi:hypothetical protein